MKGEGCDMKASFFCHNECEYFPCHDTKHPEKFNCLFCYCPLYALGEDCGGNFSYTEKGIKNCKECFLPHSEKGYDYIISKFPELAELAKQRGEKK